MQAIIAKGTNRHQYNFCSSWGVIDIHLNWELRKSSDIASHSSSKSDYIPMMHHAIISHDAATTLFVKLRSDSQGR